jgi:hypothetical protein
LKIAQAAPLAYRSDTVVSYTGNLGAQHLISSVVPGSSDSRVQPSAWRWACWTRNAQLCTQIAWLCLLPSCARQLSGLLASWPRVCCAVPQVTSVRNLCPRSSTRRACGWRAIRRAFAHDHKVGRESSARTMAAAATLRKAGTGIKPHKLVTIRFSHYNGTRGAAGGNDCRLPHSQLGDVPSWWK